MGGVLRGLLRGEGLTNRSYERLDAHLREHPNSALHGSPRSVYCSCQCSRCVKARREAKRRWWQSSDTSKWSQRERLEALEKAARPRRVYVHGVGWVDLK